MRGISTRQAKLGRQYFEGIQGVSHLWLAGGLRSQLFLGVCASMPLQVQEYKYRDGCVPVSTGALQRVRLKSLPNRYTVANNHEGVLVLIVRVRLKKKQQYLHIAYNTILVHRTLRTTVLWQGGREQGESGRTQTRASTIIEVSTPCVSSWECRRARFQAAQFM